MTNRQLFSGALSVKHLSHNYLTARLSQLDLNLTEWTMHPPNSQNIHPFSPIYSPGQNNKHPCQEDHPPIHCLSSQSSFSPLSLPESSHNVIIPCPAYLAQQVATEK